MLTLLQDSNNNKQWKSERIALLAHVAPSTAQTRHRYKHGLDDVLVFCLSLLKLYDANSGYWDPWRLSKIGSDIGCALLVFCGALPTAFFKFGWIASTWVSSIDHRRGKKLTLLLEAWCTMRHRRSCVDHARSSVVHKRKPRGISRSSMDNKLLYVDGIESFLGRRGWIDDYG